MALEKKWQDHTTAVSMFVDRGEAYRNTVQAVKMDTPLWNTWLKTLEDSDLIVKGRTVNTDDRDCFEPFEEEFSEVHLSFDKARLLQGYVSTRYMHMRQGEEKNGPGQDEAKIQPQSQALRETLKSQTISKKHKTSGKVRSLRKRRKKDELKTLAVGSLAMHEWPLSGHHQCWRGVCHLWRRQRVRWDVL